MASFWITAIFVLIGLTRKEAAAVVALSCGDTFKTDNNLYDRNLDVTSYSSLVFSYTSCYTGAISLSSSALHPHDHLVAYEIQVSHSQAYLYACHECASNSLLDSSPVSAVPSLQCLSDPRHFWLTWDSDTLLMGEGTTPGVRFLLWLEPLQHPILHLSFRNQATSTDVVWNLVNCSYSNDPVQVPPPFRVDFGSTFTTQKIAVTHFVDTSSVTNVSFTTRSCYQVYVLAAPTLSDVRGTGGNPVVTFRVTYSVIYIERAPPYELIRSIVSPLGGSFDCVNQDMSFWVNWAGGTLTMGVGTDRTATQSFVTHPLNGLDLDTFGFHATANDAPTWTLSGSPAGNSGTVTTAAAPTVTTSGTGLGNSVSASAGVPSKPEMKTWQRKKVTPSMSTSYVITDSTNDVSDLGCGRLCVSQPLCSAFSYNSTIRHCTLLTQGNATNPKAFDWLYVIV